MPTGSARERFRERPVLLVDPAAVRQRIVRGRSLPAFEKYLPLESQWFMFGIGWLLIAVFVLLCGWVEDVAGKKKPKLVPGGRTANP